MTEKFIKLVKHNMSKLEISIPDLAARCNISHTSAYKILQGKTVPSVLTAARMAQLLHISLDVAFYKEINDRFNGKSSLEIALDKQRNK